MGDKSHIEWTEATWNPITGCTKVSQGCKNCYAKHQAWPRLKASPGTVYYGRDFEDVAFHPERLDWPLRARRPRMIFVNSMGDLFHEDVTDEQIDQVFAVMALANHHVFQVLTKRPERMLEYLSVDPQTHCNRLASSLLALPWAWHTIPNWNLVAHNTKWPIPNVWLGVSVEDQATADERIPLLLKTPAAVRWISAEPLLGPIDLIHPGNRDFIALCRRAEMTGQPKPPTLDWVVAGGESGKGARPMHPEWVRSLRDQCADAGVPFFFKQWGEYRSSIRADEPEYHQEPDAYVNPTDGRTVATSDEAVAAGGLWVGVHRMGKKRAGRDLDGRTHDEYPQEAAS